MATDDIDPKPTETTEVPIGFYAPGTFAAYLSKNAENGLNPETILDNFMKFQDEFHATCTKCRMPFHVTIWTRQDVVRLLQVAQQVKYHDLYERVVKEYQDYIFTCPSCGLQSHLTENT